MNYEIGNPQYVWLLLSVPATAVALVIAGRSRRNAQRQFGIAGGFAGSVGRFVSSCLLLASMILMTAACMDIRWGKTTREVPQRGLEVVFALDVSRSMLAQDATPNRLARAKQQIKDMISEMAGDRIGLVAFAGEATQAVPLTNHYEDFRQTLDTVGPQSVMKGGSQLGPAIEAAADAFLSKTNDHKTIVLFTDGEDQESEPVALAKRLHDQIGLRVFTVGLGDIEQGSRIPDDQSRNNQYLQHEGQQVWSKLNGSILREIAIQTNAAYIPAGTKRVNMSEVYHNYIASIEKTEFESAKINAFVPRFQWFAFPAFCCLFLYLWHGTARTSEESKGTNSTSRRAARRKRSSTKPASGIAAAFVVLMPSLAFGEPPTQQAITDQVNAANKMVRDGKTAEAVKAFQAIEASGSSKYQDQVFYNSAIAHYRNSNVDTAMDLFKKTASSDDRSIASDSRYNLGNCHSKNALALMQEQPSDAISQLEQAIGHYRSALRLDRKRMDARENIERARNLIKQLREQQEQQQDKQDQQQDNQQQDEQQQDNQEQQSQEEGQGESGQSEDENQGNQEPEDSESDSDSNGQEGHQQDSQSNQSPSETTGEENANNQANSEEQGTEDQKGDESQQSDGDREQTGEQPQRSDQQPDDDKEQSLPQQSDSGEGDQQPSTDGKLTSDNQDDAKPSQDAMGTEQPDSQLDGVMTRQEAMKLLQSIRDREMLRRLLQERQKRSRRVRVEKDW